MKHSNPIILTAIILALLTLTTISGCKKETTTAVATCTDGIKNENETGIDCGGVCAACPTCSDGIKNGTETGVDCGGSCSACNTCSDGIQNGTETGVDCGGSCTACIDTSFCHNGQKDGNETYVDCGGSCRPCTNQDTLTACGGIDTTGQVFSPFGAGSYYYYLDSSLQFFNCSKNATSYLWDFGDGTTSTEATPTHAFRYSGQSQIKLSVFRSNMVASFTFSISVNSVTFGRYIAYDTCMDCGTPTTTAAEPIFSRDAPGFRFTCASFPCNCWFGSYVEGNYDYSNSTFSWQPQPVHDCSSSTVITTSGSGYFLNKSSFRYSYTLTKSTGTTHWSGTAVKY